MIFCCGSLSCDVKFVVDVGLWSLVSIWLCRGLRVVVVVVGLLIVWMLSIGGRFF